MVQYILLVLNSEQPCNTREGRVTRRSVARCRCFSRTAWTSRRRWATTLLTTTSRWTRPRPRTRRSRATTTKARPRPPRPVSSTTSASTRPTKPPSSTTWTRTTRRPSLTTTTTRSGCPPSPVRRVSRTSFRPTSGSTAGRWSRPPRRTRCRRGTGCRPSREPSPCSREPELELTTTTTITRCLPRRNTTPGLLRSRSCPACPRWVDFLPSIIAPRI